MKGSSVDNVALPQLDNTQYTVIIGPSTKALYSRMTRDFSFMRLFFLFLKAD